VAWRSGVNAAGARLIEEITPVRTPSTPIASCLTVYFPRPINSEMTRSVIRFSTSNTGVLFTNIGTPMTLMYAGRNEPRPESE
jgi:hypothetical protein